MTQPWGGGGTPVIPDAERWLPSFGIDGIFDGEGTLASTLTGYRKLSAAFTGTGSLSASLRNYRRIAADFTGTGSLDTMLVGLTKIPAAFSGEGTMGATLSGLVHIHADFTGTGTLTASTRPPIVCPFTGEGSLESYLSGYQRIAADFDGEGVLYAELLYDLPPTPLEQAHLGKLAGYSVFNSAVPLNPAEGSGSAPSVSPSFTKGTDPEFALGEELTVQNPAIGTYTGEVVRVQINEGSDVAQLSMDTLLTLANKDLHLSPFIDTAGPWTAARAIDYWTQQAGIFYDDVPGDCRLYASGYGHTQAYAAEQSLRYYEYGAGSGTAILSGRSVRTFGNDFTGVSAMYEDLALRVPVMLPYNKKLVASVGLALRGSDRTSTVLWYLESSTGKQHLLTLSATSDGDITAKLGNTVLTTASVDPDGEYRLTVSLERLSATMLAAKLTVHTDDLAGGGELIVNGAVKVKSYALPGVLQLRSLQHNSDDASGAQMMHWGTYLSVAEAHPMDLPAVQKELSEATRDFGFVSGFEGNVWKMLNEFCSIARLDIKFMDGKMHVGPRLAAVQSGMKFSRLSKTTERREKYKQVAIVNQQSKAVTGDNAVLWRADSVYQLNTREVFETTIQTEHSILSVVNPVPVPGITPFPYTAGGGQYVVTGADGYIIAPQWWLDNGGKVEASLTGKEGEIALKLTAPYVDSVRAPYRISEGAADRPALYISGSGIVNDPLEVHINTGARKAREGFDAVFSSPFIAGVQETFDTAAKMAREYSAAVADVQYELPNDFQTPTVFGQYPAGELFTDNDRNFRLTDASQGPSRVSGNAAPHTTIAAYKASYPAGSTIADEKARNRGRTIREFNIKPLRGK